MSKSNDIRGWLAIGGIVLAFSGLAARSYLSLQETEKQADTLPPTQTLPAIDHDGNKPVTSATLTVSNDKGVAVSPVPATTISECVNQAAAGASVPGGSSSILCGETIIRCKQDTFFDAAIGVTCTRAGALERNFRY